MKASELIKTLQYLINMHGDKDVIVDHDGLHHVDEVDVDTDDTGIIIWTGEEHD